MSVKYLLVSLLSYIFNSANATPTTTRVYDLDLLGPNPIRIVEGENLWKTKEDTTQPTSRFEERLFTTATSTTNLNNPLSDEQENNSAEFSHTALRDFLSSYAEKVIKNKRPDRSPSGEDKEGKKHWSLLNVREHNHPYDDKKGWVTLEPIPWSLSKISKWQSKSTTTERPWDDFPSHENKPPHNIDYSNDRLSSWNKPTLENSYHYGNRPQDNKNEYQLYYLDDDKSQYSKPSAVYGQTVHLHAHTPYQRHPVKANSYYNHDHNCNHDEDVGIITDGKPPNFPSNYYENRRIGTDLNPETNPDIGDGEWVLLSTTKGYKLPKSKQRSLEINPRSIGTHQSVSLTVLPPLKNSKVNMTTSHGGLLQVDSSFETVEQAQRKYIKLQKMKDKPKRHSKPLKKKKPTRELTSSTIATIPRNTPPDSSAVLAGVGAGMIPATMAMLVPIAMNGKRRKKRSLLLAASSPSSGVQITLPRYL
ncbi:uncharacterized protein LOC108906439 [Anoplophora glabripennis]|uniref:uncharacterized protein LOC108906439 n=1 Tax=Anoplophora glabripennis TaxID=217634 RepID=UPI0008754B3D|nr:uncharacterized protein LOC108906439 [Anoplophora glabripennis]